MPAGNEGFGVRRGVVSWDTSQEFGSFAPVQAFAKPRPTPSPRHVTCKAEQCHRYLQFIKSKFDTTNF